MDFKRVKDYFSWLYYQYQIISCCAVLEPWEQSMFNTILLTIFAMVVYTAYVFIPIHIRLAWEFFSKMCGYHTSLSNWSCLHPMNWHWYVYVAYNFCFSWVLCLFSLSDLKSSHFSMHPYILPEIWDSCFFQFFCTQYSVHQTIDNTMALPHIPYFLNLNKFSLNQEISYKTFLGSRLIRDLPESCLKCSLDTYSILKDIFLKICS